MNPSKDAVEKYPSSSEEKKKIPREPEDGFPRTVSYAGVKWQSVSATTI